MKSLKKTLVLLVVFSMILSTIVPAFAATDVAGLDCEDQVTRMEALGVIDGFEDGTFRPEETITRAQMAVIVCKMLGINEASANANAGTASKFSDVAANEWYTGWINIASNNGVIAGFPDGTFRPNETLTLNQVLTLCVKALGRGGYVDKMGTWPANYVTEAARLNLLKDVKGASDANRGTVAVICWNTLRTATWYVSSETLDGEVNLNGYDQKTLLEINFEEYTHANSSEEGKLKEVEAVVVDTPSRDKEIGDRQIVLDGISKNFDFKAKADYKKSVQDEKTYKKANGDIVAYVPEEVCEDIDALRNKNVTVIFGDDNEIALIVVEDDAVEKAFLTRYNAAEEEITVGGTKYEFSNEGYELFVNDVEIEETEDSYVKTEDTAIDTNKTYYTQSVTGTGADAVYTYTEVATPDVAAIANYYELVPAITDTLAYALNIILDGGLTNKTFDKKVQAELILDEDEDVERIDLTVSGNYPEFYTKEAVVKKVKSEKIITTVGDIEWDEDKYEDKDYPIVYIDGVKSSIADIEAGDVLTICGYDDEAKNVELIHAARQTVEGEVSRVKNKVEIYVDGEVYLPSAMTSAMNLEGDLEDLSTTAVLDFNGAHGENAVLYLNVFGEYVVVDADTVDTDWQFAVIDHIYDVVENEEDEDLFSQKLRLVMMDGTTSRSFKLVYDADKTYAAADKATTNPLATDAVLTTKLDKAVKDLIAFKANADGEIELDEIFVVDTATVANNTAIDGYDFFLVTEQSTDTTIDFDAKRFEITDGNSVATRYKVTSETSILNKVKKETLAWKSLVKEDTKKVGANTIIIVEEDETKIAHVVALTNPTVSSSVEYALVLDATYTSSKTKTEAKLLGVDGEEYVYEYKTALEDGMLISYTVSGKEMTVVSTIDVETIAEANDETSITVEGVTASKGAFRVESVESDYFVYTDDEDVVTLLPAAKRICDMNEDELTVVSYVYNEDDGTSTLEAAEFNEATLKDDADVVLVFNMDTDANDIELVVVIK